MVKKNMEKFKLLKQPPILGDADVRCGMCHAWMRFNGKYVCDSCGNEYSSRTINYFRGL